MDTITIVVILAAVAVLLLVVLRRKEEPAKPNYTQAAFDFAKLWATL